MRGCTRLRLVTLWRAFWALALGILSTVLIAITVLVIVDNGVNQVFTVSDPGSCRTETTGWTHLAVTMPHAEVNLPPDEMAARIIAQNRHAEFRTFRDGETIFPPRLADQEDIFIYGCAGVPLRCFWSWTHGMRVNGVRGPITESAGTLESTWLGPVVPARFAVLPFLPLWPALLANTAIYAALWMILFMSWTATQRARRYRRGQCLNCAYDLRGLLRTSICPECGTPREGSVTTARSASC